MENFSESLKRLKFELRVSTDGEVGRLLGLSATAFSERKKRKSFFDREILALKRARPDLSLDMDFIFTGIRAVEYEASIAQAAKSPLVSKDVVMAGYFAKLGEDMRDHLLGIAKCLVVQDVAIRVYATAKP